MKFLIQTFNNKVEHDFSLALIESIKYHKWLDSECDMSFAKTENDLDFSPYPDYIPIGSVEFVTKYLRQTHSKYPVPVNIPLDLRTYEFTLRAVFNGTEEAFWGKGEMFVKSNDRVKGFTEIVNSETYDLPTGNYQYSSLIDIDSEWRAFVYNNSLVGLQNYAGDFVLFPDVDSIHKMINAYKDAPIAYTLDVGVNTEGTFVIEVHDFYSCGLYGFSDLRKLPFMFSRWFHEFIHK